MRSRIRRGTLFLAFILVFTATGGAQALSIQARGAYFSPTDKVFREVYGYGISWGGELNIGISKNASIWAGADYFSKVGKLSLTEDETKIRIAPLAGGLKYFFTRTRLRPYVGAGAAYFQYKETSGIGTIEKGNVGLVARAGLLMMLGPAFFLDFQGGWSTCPVEPAEVKANLGGFSFGLGLGFEF